MAIRIHENTCRTVLFSVFFDFMKINKTCLPPPYFFKYKVVNMKRNILTIYMDAERVVIASLDSNADLIDWILKTTTLAFEIARNLSSLQVRKA